MATEVRKSRRRWDDRFTGTREALGQKFRSSEVEEIRKIEVGGQEEREQAVSSIKIHDYPSVKSV